MLDRQLQWVLLSPSIMVLDT